MHHSLHFLLKDHLQHQVPRYSLAQYRPKGLNSQMCARGSPQIGGHALLFSSPCIYHLQGELMEIFFLMQDIVIVVRLKLPEHINVVHIFKVGSSSNLCVIFHSIHSNNRQIEIVLMFLPGTAFLAAIPLGTSSIILSMFLLQAFESDLILSRSKSMKDWNYLRP